MIVRVFAVTSNSHVYAHMDMLLLYANDHKAVL